MPALMLTTRYSEEIQSTAEAIAEAGAPVTLTHTENAYDELSGDTVPVITTGMGSAVRVRSSSADLKRMEADGLVIADCVTLLVSALADSSGAVFAPLPNDVLAFASKSYIVRTVDSVAPDGVAILYRVIGSV